MSHDITPYFPEPLRGFVSVGAQALGCDEAYVAVPLLPALASAIGNTRRIRLKHSWTEPAVVWAGIVGESGTVKSPAFELAISPVWRRQRKLLKDHAQNKNSYEGERKAWKSTPKDARGDEPEPPSPCEHPLCVDITVEALADRLLATPRGILVAPDELAGWFGGFNQYKSGGGDVAHWLAMNGARPLKVDRKTGDRTTIYIPHAAVSVTGTIQPDTLKRMLTPEFFDNGLAARLLAAMPPEKPKKWTEEEVPQDISRAVDAIFDRLYALRQSPGVDGGDEPVMVDLTDDARGDFATFVNEHGEQMQDLEGPARAAYAKLEGYAARFALIRHCLRQASGEKLSDYIDRDDISAGVSLARWFGTESLRVYRLMHESEEAQQRRELIEWIAGRGGRVTVRDLQRYVRRYQNQRDQAEADLRALVDEGYGCWEHVRPGPKGGKPTDMFCLAASPDHPMEGNGFVRE